MEFQLCLGTRLSTLYVSSHLILTVTFYELLFHFVHKGTIPQRNYVICSRVPSKNKRTDSNPGLNRSSPLCYVSVCLFTLTRSLRNHISPLLA